MDRARRTVRALVALLIAVGAGWLPTKLGNFQTPAFARTTDITLHLSDLGDPISQASRAVAKGDYEFADTLLRRALADPARKQHAADLLWELHDLPGFRLPVSERDVAAAMRDADKPLDRYETRHFVLLSDADPDWVRARGEVMEEARKAYREQIRRLGARIAPHETKLVIILWRSKAHFSAYAEQVDRLEASWVAGYYSIADNRAIFYDDRSSIPGRLLTARQSSEHAHDSAQTGSPALLTGSDRRRSLALELADEINNAKTIHETIHLLAFNTGLQQRKRGYPIWLSEGLAVAFEPGEPGPYGPAYDTTPRLRTFQMLKARDELMDWGSVVSLLRVPEGDLAIEQLYAQSYALFSHLFRSHPKSLVAYYNRLNSQALPRTAQGRIALFESCFGPLEDVIAEIMGD